MNTVYMHPKFYAEVVQRGDNHPVINTFLLILQELNMSYSFDAGNIDYIISDDGALTALNAYPNGIAATLSDKSLLPKILEPYGFKALSSEIIANPQNITLANFIVKPVVSSGSCVEGSKDKNVFAGVEFSNKEALLAHPLIEYLTPNKYIAQESAGGSSHISTNIYCSVDSEGTCYFWRSTLDDWVNGARVKSSLFTDMHTVEKQKIAAAVKGLNIKNTMFNLQLVKKGEDWCPVDWNFRWGRNGHKQILSREPQEYRKAVLHMLGIAKAEPNNATYAIVTEKEELDNL